MENATNYTVSLPDKKVKLPCITMHRTYLPPHNITVLPATPSSNIMVDVDGKMAVQCSEETAMQRDPTQLQDHFKWLQDKLGQLQTAANTSAHTEELAHLTNILQ